MNKVNRYYSSIVSGQSRSSVFVPFSPYLNNGLESVESEETTSHHRLHGGRWSGGGAWFLNREKYSYYPRELNIHKETAGGSTLVEGTARIESPTSSVTSLAIPATPSNTQLDADGTTAIARTEPTSPAFDLSVFLGELRAEGLPNLPGTALMEKTRLAKKAGSEYLNVEFGWLPALRGLRDFASTVEKSDQITRSYQERANSVTKRRYQWPTIEESRADACSFSMSPAVGFFTRGGRHQYAFQRKWFEVEYIYYLPTGGSFSDKLRRYGSYARKLYGLDLSPEVLWNLAPWSWAADWFANCGDVMHNISALGTDGLVIRNGYIMCHSGKITSDTGTLTLTGMKDVDQTRVTTKETKVRRPATPFGFGVAYSSLSTTQLAVISALGLSRW